MFLGCTNPKKQNKNSRLVIVRARTALKILLRYRTGKIKANPLQPHFETSATMSQSLEGTKTAVGLSHCSESTQESITGWCIFGSTVWLKLWQSDGMSYKRKYTGRGASNCRFVQKFGEMTFFFCGRCNTGGDWMLRAAKCLPVFASLAERNYVLE